MSFKRRIINLSFQLSSGNFGTDGQDTVTFEGLRCSVDIVHSGIGGAKAQVQVWGMSLDLMNKLTVTQKFYFEQSVPNKLTITAGDEDGMSVCFAGGILEAWADGRQAPDMVFVVTAASGLVDSAIAVAPTSYRGGVDAGLVLEGMAAQMGYTFENSGVSATLHNPYKPGSLKSQIRSVCDDIDCNWTLDEVNKVLAVWPRRQARAGEVIRIAPDTGMVGYPSFSQGGVQLTTMFNPSLGFGRKIQIDSQFRPANGLWKVSSLAHRLETNLPNGAWFSDVETTYLDYQPN